MRAQAMEKAPSHHQTATHASAHAPRTYVSNPLALISPSFEAFKLAWVNLLLVALAVVGALLAFVAIVVVAGPVGVLIGVLLSFPLIFFIGGFSGWMLTKITIAAARGQKLSFKEAMPQTFSEPWKYIWTCILMGLVIGVGFILFIVPGIIFLAWFAMAPYLMVDKGVWGADALSQARELARRRNWDVLGVLSLNSALSLLLLIPFLGFLIYIILTFILIPLQAVRYDSLLELKAHPGWESVPTHPLNYVVLVVAIIATGLSSTSQLNTDLKNLQEQSQLENNLKAY